MVFLVQYIYLIYYTTSLYLAYSKNYMLSILYDIICNDLKLELRLQLRQSLEKE